MRLFSCCILIVVSGLCTAFAQDTNFATGPQYLMNYGLPLFAHSIATPSISLAGPPLEVGASDATGVLNAGASIEDVLPYNPDNLPKIDLFPIFYGTPLASVVEISFPESQESPRSLPASILDDGVWQMTTAEALRARGYGVTLVEAAAYDKAHRKPATHVYTNEDIAGLHGGS